MARRIAYPRGCSRILRPYRFNRSLLRLFIQEQREPRYPLAVDRQFKRIAAGRGKLKLVEIDDNIHGRKLAVGRFPDRNISLDRLNDLLAPAVDQPEPEIMIPAFFSSEP